MPSKPKKAIKLPTCSWRYLTGRFCKEIATWVFKKRAKYCQYHHDKLDEFFPGDAKRKEWKKL